jgi:hypothetical protein
MTFYCILLVTMSVLIFTISNYQVSNASSTDIKTHDNKKNKGNINSNSHDNKKNKESKDSMFFLPFNSNFADQSIKTNKEKNDIIPFP